MFVLKRIGSALAIILPAFLIMAGLSACYTDYGMTTSDYDVVTTLYDKNYNFSADQTYFMPDTIQHILAEGEKDDISRKYDSFILDQVASQMNLRGFRRITDVTQEEPDVAILLAVTTKENYVAYANYYWGGYWPGYGGWGGYYPWYGGTTVYSYSTGTLFINMLDPERANDDDKLIPTVWVGAVNGLLGDSATNTRVRLSNSIGQAFIQSPYLGHSE